MHTPQDISYISVRFMHLLIGHIGNARYILEVADLPL